MKTAPTVHVYLPDGLPDALGHDRCAQAGCGLPATNVRHALPEVTDDMREIDARRTGDKEDLK